MSAKNTTQVIIGGKIITLCGYESEEYLQRVAAYLNNKISELSELPGYNRQQVEMKQTLLSLNIADDYFKAKKQAEIFEEDSQLKDKEMYDLKHDLISLQIQNEALKKEIEQAQAERKTLEEENARLAGEVDELLKG
ncbi:MAG TPA: cell division protein ZapA [Candidatus Egerieimonas intestinavium]|uniref:Cell division protein ZapA n=1 Tax=Candidatus Egerieimonas intestinavium TaxID=2840777 RepID=A0A9D1JH15_9FIRM|nr:cell division protein ZapA [Candidatus Egerieimonas intestinavium]